MGKVAQQQCMKDTGVLQNNAMFPTSVSVHLKQIQWCLVNPDMLVSKKISGLSSFPEQRITYLEPWITVHIRVFSSKWDKQKNRFFFFFLSRSLHNIFWPCGY